MFAFTYAETFHFLMAYTIFGKVKWRQNPRN